MHDIFRTVLTLLFVCVGSFVHRASAIDNVQDAPKSTADRSGNKVEQPSAIASEEPSLDEFSERDIRKAAERAVELVERTSTEFLTRRECFTCHTQTLSVMVLNDARHRGFKIDYANFKKQYERSLEDSMFGGVRVDTVGYALWALDIGRYRPDDKTRQLVKYLLNYEKDLGIWKTTVDRPPAEASNFTTNYVAIRGLHRFGNTEQEDEIQARANAIKQWMVKAVAVDTEDQVFRLRLSRELKISRSDVDEYAKRLLEEQHDNGGWAQTAEMKPDAYATGSVLVALRQTAQVGNNHPAWKSGIRFLLRTQRPEGSWHVATRAKPLQEYFESGFPHGKDQFLSAFATGWATEALLLALPPSEEQPPSKK